VTGLHGKAERRRQGVTVYLVPGLTACQRRAVIRRLRQEASRGVGPALPLPQLTMALGLDRLRSAARIAGAIVRLHPAGALLPGALAAALMTVFVIASADGSGLMTGQRPGFADAAAAEPGGPQVVTEAVVPGRGAAVTAAAGAMGLNSERAALGGHAQARTRAGSRGVPLYRRPGAWYACSPVMIGPLPGPLAGQPGCGRPASRLGPYTAQLPDPRAFAT
jgi:hypothetical protein